MVIPNGPTETQVQGADSGEDEYSCILSRKLTTMQNHGGTVVLMEKDADVKLVDHTRKNLPDDTYSLPSSPDSDQYTDLM